MCRKVLIWEQPENSSGISVWEQPSLIFVPVPSRKLSFSVWEPQQSTPSVFIFVYESIPAYIFLIHCCSYFPFRVNSVSIFCLCFEQERLSRSCICTSGSGDTHRNLFSRGKLIFLVCAPRLNGLKFSDYESELVVKPLILHVHVFGLCEDNVIPRERSTLMIHYTILHISII